MNDTPLSTGLLARLARAAIVTGSLALPALVAVAASPDFRDAIGDLVGDATWATVVVLVISAALTQLAGTLVGKAKK